MDYADLKRNVNDLCLQTVGDRLDMIEKNLKDLMHAKENETKSSAGDKYETGRAMIQNQEELYKTQRAQTREILQVLLKIDPEKSCIQVEPGALVILPSGFYYLSAGMGKMMSDGVDFFALSIGSPLGQAMKYKAAGETFIFNNNEIVILNIF
jgi:hypothetical protein